MTASEVKDEIATLERILKQHDHRLFVSLARLRDEIHKMPNPWIFPAEEGGVSGFAGLAPVFVVGEQPSGGASGKPWTPRNTGRRTLYDTLVACGAEQVHVTDIIKSRGDAHEWRRWPPSRLDPHIDLFRRELQELQPEFLILLGNDSRDLLSAHFPEYVASARCVPHFAYARWGKSARARFQGELKDALRGCLVDFKPTADSRSCQAESVQATRRATVSSDFQPGPDR